MHGTFGIHDSIVQKQGAYTKLIKAIHNAFDLDLRVRINCTVTMENYNNIQHNFVEEILKILNKYPLAQLNFIFYNYWDDNKTGEIIDYKILAEAVSNAIKQIKEKYSEFDIRLRYLPFCMIDTEFQPLIYGQFQHLFDTTDWNKEIYSGTKYFPKMNFTWDHSLRLGWEAARDSRLHSYYKPKECFKCKHYQWCDGLELPLKNHKVYPIYE
jgi:MoaA/NifB/PqqE/SkfB family radical SAM enzyme